MLRCIAPILVLFCVVFLGCATSAKQDADAEQLQGEALSRWKGCLNRQTAKLQQAAVTEHSEQLHEHALKSAIVKTRL